MCRNCIKTERHPSPLRPQCSKQQQLQQQSRRGAGVAGLKAPPAWRALGSSPLKVCGAPRGPPHRQASFSAAAVANATKPADGRKLRQAGGPLGGPPYVKRGEWVLRPGRRAGSRRDPLWRGAPAQKTQSAAAAALAAAGTGAAKPAAAAAAARATVTAASAPVKAAATSTVTKAAAAASLMTRRTEGFGQSRGPIARGGSGLLRGGPVRGPPRLVRLHLGLVKDAVATTPEPSRTSSTSSINDELVEMKGFVLGDKGPPLKGHLRGPPHHGPLHKQNDIVAKAKTFTAPRLHAWCQQQQQPHQQEALLHQQQQQQLLVLSARASSASTAHTPAATLGQEEAVRLKVAPLWGGSAAARNKASANHEASTGDRFPARITRPQLGIVSLGSSPEPRAHEHHSPGGYHLEKKLHIHRTTDVFVTSLSPRSTAGLVGLLLSLEGTGATSVTVWGPHAIRTLLELAKKSFAGLHQLEINYRLTGPPEAPPSLSDAIYCTHGVCSGGCRPRTRASSITSSSSSGNNNNTSRAKGPRTCACSYGPSLKGTASGIPVEAYFLPHSSRQQQQQQASNPLFGIDEGAAPAADEQEAAAATPASAPNAADAAAAYAVEEDLGPKRRKLAGTVGRHELLLLLLAGFNAAAAAAAADVALHREAATAAASAAGAAMAGASAVAADAAATSSPSSGMEAAKAALFGDFKETADCVFLLLRCPTLPGRFFPEKAKALGIPPGPAYARLKSGERVQLGDGRWIDPTEVCSEPQPGKAFAFVECLEPQQALKAVSSSSPRSKWQQQQQQRQQLVWLGLDAVAAAADAAVAAAADAAVAAAVAAAAPGFRPADEEMPRSSGA
ncbi:hypothetical protein ACSSS7_000995 [Eimeria intestinalis]